MNSLFQDLHVLSLIWTHPWCLKLAQLSRNKVHTHTHPDNTTVQTFGVSKIYFLKEMNTFVQQGHVKLIKRDSKDIYVTKDFYFKQMLFL